MGNIFHRVEIEVHRMALAELEASMGKAQQIMYKPVSIDPNISKPKEVDLDPDISKPSKPKKVDLDLDISEWTAEEKLSEITDFEVIRDHFVTSFPDFYKHLTTVHDEHVNEQKMCPHDTQVYSQHGGTCYAHACADGVIAARKRIIGSPPISHAHLTGALVYCYGRKGKNSSKVLDEICKFFRLRCEKLTKLSKAIDAIEHNRALVGAFYLTAKQWAAWTLYWYDKSNASIGLSKGDLDDMYSDDQLEPLLKSAEDGGHAVLIVGFENGFFKIKNSWGDKWASKGYALVEPAFFHCFVDVYWVLEDLLPSEILEE